MNKGKKNDNGLFTMSRQGSVELTHETVEYYLSKGRRMQSAYVCGLLYRWIGAVFARTIGRCGPIPGERRRCHVGISGERQFYY